MIPAEAVEAAAKAIAERLAANEHGWVDADDVAGMVIDVRDFDMRAAISSALEAAAPIIRAQALEDAADIAGRSENRWWAEGQNRAKWLRNLAAAERGSK